MLSLEIMNLLQDGIEKKFSEFCFLQGIVEVQSIVIFRQFSFTFSVIFATNWLNFAKIIKVLETLTQSP